LAVKILVWHYLALFFESGIEFSSLAVTINFGVISAWI